MDKPVIPELSLSTPGEDEDSLHAHTPHRIAETLKTHICQGSIAPGTKLSEEVIATEFDVSRNTLREAFTILAGEGLVSKVPNRGVFVIQPGPEDVQEIYRTRRFLEPSAILWGRLTPQISDRLNEVADQIRRGLAQENIASVIEADRNFHLAVVSLANSETMTQSLDRLLTRLNLAFHNLNVSLPVHDTFANQNLAITQRILAGERIEASRGIHRYLGLAESMVLKHSGVDETLSAHQDELSQ